MNQRARVINQDIERTITLFERGNEMLNPLALAEVSLDQFSLASRSADSIQQFGACLMARVVMSQDKCPAGGQSKSSLGSDTSACPGHNGCHPLKPLIYIIHDVAPKVPQESRGRIGLTKAQRIAAQISGMVPKPIKTGR